MKKLLALMLALALCLSLVACGNSGGTSAPAEESAEAPAEEPAEDRDEVPAGEADEAPAEDLGDPVTLTAATSMNETDALGIYWLYFKDYVEEKSGGNITIDLYTSGTLGGADEYLNMMKANTLDLCANYAPFNAFATPVAVTILNGMNSASEALEYSKYIVKENPDSSAVFAAEHAEYNATVLGAGMPIGYHVFVSTNEFDSYQDMLDNAVLGSVSESCYKEQGFKNFVTIDPTAVYESLRTGVCDTVDYDSSTIMTQKLYELAKTVCVYELYPIMDFYLVNTETWNSLSDGQRAIIADAVEATTEYACQYIEDLNAELMDTMTQNGAKVIEMSDEEFAFVRDLNVTYNYSSMLSGLGGATGKTDDLIPCVKAGMTFYADNYGADYGDLDQFVDDALSAMPPA